MRIRLPLWIRNRFVPASKPAKAFSFRKAAVWCTACAAVLIAVPAILVGTGVTKTADSMTAEMQNEAVAGDMETNAASAEEDGFVKELSQQIRQQHLHCPKWSIMRSFP